MKFGVTGHLSLNILEICVSLFVHGNIDLGKNYLSYLISLVFPLYCMPESGVYYSNAPQGPIEE